MRDQLREFRDHCDGLAKELGLDGEELFEWWSERAAIREVDGGQSRADAEAAALDDLRGAFTEPRRGPLRAGLASVAKRSTSNE